MSQSCKVTQGDRDVLRGLAARQAQIALLDVQQERISLWGQFNQLRPARPMVLSYPEGGWRELIPESQLECNDPLLRAWELQLRKSIYQHEKIGDDHPVTSFFDVANVVKMGDYGLVEENMRSAELGAYNWKPPVHNESDVDKLHFRSIKIDRDETQRQLELAESILGDILKVRIHGALWWSCGMTGSLIKLRGMEQIMMDMYDKPDLLHRMMALLRDDMMNMLDILEREGVLCLNNGPDFVGSAGIGVTDELPCDDFDGVARVKDTWGLGESQEFVGVGPEQFNEFALQYQLPILNRFGLVCYGCCEPLDKKYDLLIDNLSKLRRVSVSSWADREIAAKKLGDKYIYSWKPNPALICSKGVDYEQIENIIRETIEIARGCCLEIIMKDTHTFCNDPERVSKWTQIANQLAQEAAA